MHSPHIRTGFWLISLPALLALMCSLSACGRRQSAPAGPGAAAPAPDVAAVQKRDMAEACVEDGVLEPKRVAAIPIDPALRVLETYAEKPFLSVSDPDLDLAGEDEKKAMEQKREDNKELLERIKTSLGDKVSDVQLTDRLKNAVACLTGEEGMSVEMYKVLRNMPNGDKVPMRFKLELNPDHPVFQKMATLDDDTLADYAALVLDQAKLMAGLPPEDPTAFSDAVCKLM